MSVAQNAEPILGSAQFGITNSMFVSWIVTIFLILLAKAATKDMKLVPTGLQNLIEFFIEGIYNLLEGILGEHLMKKTFWFFCSLFLFIMFSNWAGLIPWTGNFVLFDSNPADPSHPHHIGIFRPGTADVSMNLAMGLVFMGFWLIWAIQENGFKGFIKHIFAPKGEFSGGMLVMMVVLSLLIGLIELVSIAFRPISLCLRLYGNIFGGENVMHSMSHPIVQVPFYFLELMVGMIQALVFTMLSAVFTALICEHDHGHEEEH